MEFPFAMKTLQNSSTCDQILNQLPNSQQPSGRINYHSCATVYDSFVTVLYSEAINYDCLTTVRGRISTKCAPFGIDLLR